MNQTLRSLLAAAGVEVAADGMDVLILNSTGPVPAHTSGLDTLIARGFNFLILAPDGSPSHYGKVRPADAPRLKWDTVVRSTLRRDAELAGIVPEAHGAASHELTIQVAPFIPGRPLSRDWAGLPASARSALTEAVLTMADLISDKSVGLLPALRSATPVSLEEEAAPHLRWLASTGVASPQVEAVAAALRGTAVSRKPQHGDLWTGNVLRHRTRLTLLDYELFGVIQVPLYDVSHFLRTGHDLQCANGSEQTWFDHLRRGGADAMAAQRTLRDRMRAAGLDRNRGLACVIYYLVDIAGRLVARGTTHSERFVADVAAAADALAAGVALDEVFFGQERP